MLDGGQSFGSQTSVSQAIRSLLNDDASRRVALELRSQLAAIGVGSTDRIIIDGLPPGASLTAGQCKAGRSWTILPNEMDEVDFVAAQADGQSHTLEVYVLTPDPVDCDLAKTKGQIQITVTTPLAAQPEPSSVPPAALNGSPMELPDNVIRLPGDTSAAGVHAPDLPPEIEASDEIRNAVEQYIAVAQTEWQAETTRQVSAAEARIRTQHQDQLAVIESLLATEEQMRTAALEAKWQGEIERQVAAAEARLTSRHKEQMASVEARWRAKQAVRPGSGGTPSIDIDALLDDERQRWRSEQAETLAAARAEWESVAERRLADARSEWQIDEARRVAAVRESWQAEQTGFRNAAEAEWKAELERQVAAVEARLNAQRDEEMRAAEARWRAEAEQRATRTASADTANAAEIETRLRTEYDARMAAAEAKLSREYHERLATLEAAWQAKTAEQVAAAGASQEKIDEVLAAAKAAWEAAEAERRARLEAELQTATQQQMTAIETQLTALYEMRMAAAEVAWKRGDAERMAAIELTWRKAEAERMSAAEAKWRAEHERRMEVVLQNAVNMIKGQFGTMTGNMLPPINPSMPTPARAEPKAERTAASEAESAEKSTVTHLRAVAAA
jgi:colicin import membrane protein